MNGGDFLTKFHYRKCGPCCANCRHGLMNQDSETVCDHPLLQEGDNHKGAWRNDWAPPRYVVEVRCGCVCDKWEKQEKTI